MEQRTEEHGSRPAGGGYFAGFAPWIVFDVVASPSTWEYASLAALVTAVLLGRPSAGRGGWKILDVAGIAFFAVMSLLALFLGRDDLEWLETYAQPISSGVLAVVAFGSLLFDPFTAQYARESTPRQYWDSPVFRRVNRLLTAVWGLVFAVIAVLGVVAVHVEGGDDWLNWVIPVALIAAAFTFSSRYPDSVRRRTAVDGARAGGGATAGAGVRDDRGGGPGRPG
ncbi:hypothetical protein [Streptomyces sp. NRRL B-24484]|uniref:hypothetical protein n=1 Tax=Streptomyces sp. NRRL B-24484 TaxID=1463833 RepID=UPI0007C4CCE8|nr:hypothetical protein [Streptomyces sp. NRRL B-24484]